jgi:integral membrane protein (TIGR01906 family)
LKHLLVSIVRLLIAFAMPFFLLLTSAHLLIADWYPRYEYAKTDFPADPYGFTQAQRLDLALVSIHYMQRPEPADAVINMLKDQRLPGSDQPLFAASEISHMLDVKRVADALWRVQLIAGIIVVGGTALLLIRSNTRDSAYSALFWGGVLTTGLLILLALFVLLSWYTFFVTLHDAFFAPGTWTFDWSNSLIRLYPDKFWSDAGTLITMSALVAGILVALAGYFLGRRKNVSQG